MPPDVTLPESLALLLGALRPCFTGPSFRTFCGLVAGLAGQVRRRTVVGMLVGACLERLWPHDRAHYFFAGARWDPDELGLGVARLAAALLVPQGAALRVAVDDSVFRRSGRKVHGAGWQYDGSSPAESKISYGNCIPLPASRLAACASPPRARERAAATGTAVWPPTSPAWVAAAPRSASAVMGESSGR